MPFKIGATDIFKDELVFKMSNIVFFYKVVSFLVSPEISLLNVGSSKFMCNRSFKHSLHLHEMNFVQKWLMVCIIRILEKAFFLFSLMSLSRFFHSETSFVSHVASAGLESTPDTVVILEQLFIKKS